MDGKLILYYAWIILGVYLLWLFIKLAIPKIKEVNAMEDNLAWFKESSITHKIAEVFIWVPSFFIILFSFYRPPNFLLELIDYTDELMFVGGIIAFYSIFDARTKKYWWTYPFIIIGLWGIFGGWIGRNWLVPMVS